ncbi:MAG TPA: 16S rRNA (guanine(966)-N(2))-methyltransferase RsmD [Roseomonas sp.]|jgi:16S rRNA (guanine966-N2)-methyltransferase
MPRVIAGSLRGRVLAAPAGLATRPTAERLRQAVFDMLWHSDWGGRDWLAAQRVLDGFAGTGALGLEALSRGAAGAIFIENDRAALAALRANIAACRMEDHARVVAGDATRPPRATARCGLVFLDPPYAEGLVPRAVAALTAAGWIAPGAVLVAEHGREEALTIEGWVPLAERAHGAGAVSILRFGDAGPA